MCRFTDPADDGDPAAALPLPNLDDALDDAEYAPDDGDFDIEPEEERPSAW